MTFFDAHLNIYYKALLINLSIIMKPNVALIDIKQSILSFNSVKDFYSNSKVRWRR